MRANQLNIRQKKVIKELIHFGRREYREKRPIQIQIVQTKGTTFLTRGYLPSLIIKEHQFIQYVVLAEYIDVYRLYLFDIKGMLLGAENIEKEPPVLEKLLKSSKILYYIP